LTSSIWWPPVTPGRALAEQAAAGQIALELAKLLRLETPLATACSVSAKTPPVACIP
jgi:hypothetical protein